MAIDSSRKQEDMSTNLDLDHLFVSQGDLTGVCFGGQGENKRADGVRHASKPGDRRLREERITG